VAIARFSIAQYYAQTFTTLTANSYLSSLAIDSNGNPWFAEMLGLESRIATIDGEGHLIEHAIAESDQGLTAVTPSSDGSVWFFDDGDRRVARLDGSGNVLHYGTPNRFQIEFRPAPDGALWAADFDGGSVEHIDPTTGRVRSYVLAHSDPGEENAQIAVGESGTLIHTSYGLGRVATVSADGLVVDKKLGWNCGPNGPRPWGSGFLVSCWEGSIRALTTDAQLHEIKQLDVGADPSPMRSSGTLCADRMWFGSEAQHGFVGIDKESHRFFLPYAGQTFDAVCAGDNLWLIEHPSSTASIAVSIDMNGNVKRHTLPETTRDSSNRPGIDRLVPDAVGNIWFLAIGNMAVYRLSASGALERIPVRPKPVRLPQ
jgi:streptogramin lyase